MSRTIAAKNAVGSRKNGFDVLSVGTSFCLCLSVLAALGIRTFSEFIAVHILGEPETAGMLDILALSIPVSTIHTCIVSYYYAQKKTGIPSVAQLLEQIVRVFSSYLVYQIMLARGMQPNATLTVIGMLAGEVAASLFTLIAITWESSKYKYHFHPNVIKNNFRELFTLSYPLTANRICITMLHSVEAVLIPSRLRLCGLSNNEALATYGVITGMALPMVLFPSALTSSVAVMLLPSVAEDQASGNDKNVNRTIEATIKYCLILGIFAVGVFCAYGQSIGTLFFQNKEAGKYLQILGFISPFLYLNSTLTSILNGLGKTRLCFYQNIVSLSIRILFVLFAIPSFGVKGYLWGLLFSELTASILNITFLKKSASFSFNAMQCILKPSGLLLIALGISFAAEGILENFLPKGSILNLILVILIMGISYLSFYLPTVRRLKN